MSGNVVAGRDRGRRRVLYILQSVHMGPCTDRVRDRQADRLTKSDKEN